MVCLPLPLLPTDESGLRTAYDSVNGEAVEVCVPPGIDEAAEKLGIRDSVGCISLVQVIPSTLAMLLFVKRVHEPWANFSRSTVWLYTPKAARVFLADVGICTSP